MSAVVPAKRQVPVEPCVKVEVEANVLPPVFVTPAAVLVKLAVPLKVAPLR